MPAFESLGELSDWVGSHRGRIEIVDPGVPLTDLGGPDAAVISNVWATQPSVRKVVDFIARNVASIPFHVYERLAEGDRPRVTDHPLAAVLNRPQPGKSRFRFWHTVLVDWLLYDRWAVLKVPQLDGSMRLQRLPARRIRMMCDGLDEVQSIRVFTEAGRWEDKAPDTCLYDHGYAHRGANGTSPMRTLSALLQEQTEAVEYRRSVYANGARVPAVLERPQGAPDWIANGGRDRFASSWRKFVRGGNKEGGTPILEDGMKLVTVDAFTPADTKVMESRQLADGEVASAFHIAPELVGAREANYSSLDAHRQMLYRDGLGPLIFQFEDVLDAQLTSDLAEGRPLYVEANVDSKLRGSFEEQARILQSAVGAPWLKRNEARGRQNLPAVQGGDELVTPLNVLVGGLASPRDTDPTKRGEPRTKSRPADLATGAREYAVFAERLVDVVAGKAEALRAALGAEGGGLPDLLGAWGPAGAAEEQLAGVILGHTERLAAAGAWDVLEVYDPEAAGWSAEVMTPWLAKAAGSHARRLAAAGYEGLAAAVVATDRPAAVAAAAARWVATAKTEARRIATESAAFGAQDAAHSAQLPRKTWHTAAGETHHAALDGQAVAAAELFGNGLRWPGDPGGPVGEVYGCACTVTYGREE